MNADLNAALSIALPLPALPGNARLERWGKSGFFWNLGSAVQAPHENIVRVTRKQIFQ